MIRMSYRCPVRPGMTWDSASTAGLFMLAEIHKFTAEEYKQYQKSLKSMSELDNVIRSTEERAEMRGLEKGRAEGLAEGRAEVIQKMLDAGVPASSIQDALGISVEEFLK